MGRAAAVIHYYIEYLFKVFLVVLGVRAVLMIIDVPIGPIPVLDPIIYLLWDLAKIAIKLIADCPYIPRFG